MLDFLNLLSGYGDMGDLCDDAAPVLKLLGIVFKGIQIVVPIMLIIIGMLDMAKAVGQKSDEDIKKAQQGLIKKAIAAVIVFFIVFIVNLLMKLVGQDDYQDCLPCITNPFGSKCEAVIEGNDLVDLEE